MGRMGYIVVDKNKDFDILALKNNVIYSGLLQIYKLRESIG